MMPGVGDISFHTTEAVFDFIDKNIGSDSETGEIAICMDVVIK